MSPLAERGWQSRDSADIFVDGFVGVFVDGFVDGFVNSHELFTLHTGPFTLLEREFSCQNS